MAVRTQKLGEDRLTRHWAGLCGKLGGSEEQAPLCLLLRFTSFSLYNFQMPRYVLSECELPAKVVLEPASENAGQLGGPSISGTGTVGSLPCVMMLPAAFPHPR